MAYEFNLYGLAELIKDMHRHNQDIDEFLFTYNKTRFHAIVDIGSVPFQLLLGTFNHNWACVLSVKKGYITSMDASDFRRLCEVLHLKPGKGEFTSFEFLKYIDSHAPIMCSLKPVQPSHIMPFRKKYIKTADEPNKTVFIGWNDHKLDKKEARNFDKTRLFLGDKVADFCQKHNISSRWTTPEKTAEKPISYPSGFSLK